MRQKLLQVRLQYIRNNN